MAAKALLPGNDGLSVDANVGQAKADGDGSVSQQANTAVAVSGGTESNTFQAPVEKVVNDSGLEWWEFGAIVLLAGWAIPSPGEMLRGALGIFTGGRRASKPRRPLR